ncbi:MAG: glutamate 5-kinase [Planctomycetes bacterium]|nr:glutamate 5-kinase [Planctomycetota bacterium]
MSSEIGKRAAAARKALARASRVVVKLGTNVVMHANGALAIGRLGGIIEDIVAVRGRGCQVILVSSGAMGLGRSRIGATGEVLPVKQACAAVGQVLLMSVYEEAFGRFGIPVAQLLLTEEDFSSRRRYLNLRNTFSALLEHGVLPVVNENDPVSTAEIEIAPRAGRAFGDNDKLSALVMSRMDAEALVVLSNVSGLYSAPGPEKGGKLIDVVGEIDALAGDTAGGASATGRGGMRTKLEAMRIATDSGGIGVIAGGKTPGALTRVLGGRKEGTLFLPGRKLSSRKRWIAFARGFDGRVVVTEGARKALQERGASLLFAGIVAVEGDFERGDAVAVADEKGAEFARGMANHAAAAARLLLGKHSKAVASLTHEPNYDCFVTRDNLVIL